MYKYIELCELRGIFTHRVASSPLGGCDRTPTCRAKKCSSAERLIAACGSAQAHSGATRLTPVCRLYVQNYYHKDRTADMVARVSAPSRSCSLVSHAARQCASRRRKRQRTTSLAIEQFLAQHLSRRTSHVMRAPTRRSAARMACCSRDQ